MKYGTLTLLFIVSFIVFSLLNFYHNGWQYVQPFLITTLLVYFNVKNPWIYYSYGFLAGMTLDAFTGILGLHAFIFIIIIFILSILQYTILTAKNILSVIILTVLALLLHWLLFWGLDAMLAIDYYIFDQQQFSNLIKSLGVSLLVIIFLHLLYFNIWLKKRDYEGQPF